MDVPSSFALHSLHPDVPSTCGTRASGPGKLPGRGFALPPWFSDGSEKRYRFSVQLFPWCKVKSEKFQALMCLSWKVKA